ncbi:TPA: hypothetical protein DEW05_02605 [Candidatus Saccharibacteria bacterium]|nr:hypothetical protein [Candidatus Saccharibacteria bacterium]
MKSQSIISIEEARKILRKFDLPSQLLEEAQLVDIINRLDSVAYLYITGIRENDEPRHTLEA